MTEADSKIEIPTTPPSIMSEEQVIVKFGEKKKRKKVKRGEQTVVPGKEESRLLYTYKELLERVYQIHLKNNPALAEQVLNKKRFVMKPVQVIKDGPKRSLWLNFKETCENLNRSQSHVRDYFVAELGTNCFITEDKVLRIKGKFMNQNIETVLRRYIREYVICKSCRSHQTQISRDSRLYFIECKICKTKNSVMPIKSGFHAVTKADRKANKV